MKKRLVGVLLVSLIAGAVATGCGKADVSSNEDVDTNNEEQAAVEDDAKIEEDAKIEDDGDAADIDLDDYDSFSKKTDVLPEYEYPGPEAFYYEVYDYVEDLNESYPEADVSIPCIRIIDVDESDKSDIKVYGDFYIFNYNLAGDTLTCASGGDYPGVMHVMFDEDGYEVTKFDVVADGEDFIPSAKEIFGDKYEDFMKVESDQEDREAVRAQIISNYVFANNLDVKYYQDYGWDKQSLPEQNIDSFYSVLD